MKQMSSIIRTAVALVLAAPTVALAAMPLGNEIQLSETTSGAQQSPRLVFNPASGEYVVAWQSGLELGANDVFARRYDSSGNSLGGELQVNTTTADDQANPVVAGLPDGGFAVLWESFGQDGQSFGVFGQRFSSAGAPAGTEFQVNSYTLNSQETPELCADASGNVLAVWESRDQDGDNPGVFGRRFDAAMNPLGAEFQVNTFTQSLQGAPRIACQPTAGGDRVVMWESLGQEGQPDRGIYAQRLAADGSRIGPEFQVNTYIYYNQSVPAAAIDDDGSFVIAWGSNTEDGEGMGVFLRRFDSAGTPLGSETQVNTFIFDRQRNPRIAMDDGGDFVVVWESYNQEGRRSRWGSFAQRYSNSGDPIGREFLVNSYVRRSQGDPDIAMNAADGKFLIVWNSELQDGSDFGVYGQRFASSELCAPAPIGGCALPGHASLRVRNDGCDSSTNPCSTKNIKDIVQWKWAKPAIPTTLSPFGPDHMPDTGDEEPLALCIYDETGGVPTLKGTIVVPASGACFKNSCWRGDSTAKYRDRDQSPNGVRKLVISPQSVKLFARGPLVQPPALPLADDSHVRVQLVTSGGACVESVFENDTHTVIENDLNGFQARN